MAFRVGIVLGILAAGCASGSRFRCADHGGAEWSEYRSDHFIVATDASESDAAQLVQRLEELRAADLDALLGEQVEIPGRLRVLAFARSDEFQAFRGPFVGGYYGLDNWGRPSIVFPVNALQTYPQVLAHELAHYISYYLYPVQPRWFSEGIAAFVETIAAWDHGEPLAGAMPYGYSQFIRNDARLPARELLAWNGVEKSWSPGRYHAWSWLLYHWLWNQRSRQFAAYQKHLLDGDDPDTAWLAAFPEFDPSRPEAMGALDTELSRYVTRPNWAAYRVRVEGSSRFTKARLSPSDVHMLHLGLRRAWPQDKNATAAFIREQAEEALREDPHNAGAMLALAYLDGPPNSERVRAIVASVPADWRGWRVLGGLRDVPSAEREMANRKAIELNPEDAMSLNNLAWLLALSDRPSEALAFANRALDLAPWNSNYIDTLAEIAARMKRCSEALRLIGRASRILELRGENRETTSKRQSAIAGQCPTTSAAH